MEFSFHHTLKKKENSDGRRRKAKVDFLHMLFTRIESHHTRGEQERSADGGEALGNDFQLYSLQAIRKLVRNWY